MYRNNIEVRLLVKGRPITEYFHNGNTFVEGRDGSQFEIEIKNNNPFRAEAIISVDGLSVIDGKEASDRSSGYLLEANQTLRIPGWKLDSQSVAAFVFSGKEDSYAQQSTGSARNTGVIGVMAYREKARTQVNNYHVQLRSAFPGGAGSLSKGITGGVARGISPHPMLGTSTCGSVSDNVFYNAVAMGAPAAFNNCASIATSATVSSAAPVEALNNLGTGFGEAQNFATTTVQFERGDMLAVAILYYDNARGLKARGIQIGRPSRTRYQQQPQAFPGMQDGCTPPPGWNG